MSADLVVIDPAAGTELFREPTGERRIPWSSIVDVDRATLAEFQRQVTAYMSAHPRLEVVMLDAKARDEMVIRWRWRR